MKILTNFTSRILGIAAVFIVVLSIVFVDDSVGYAQDANEFIYLPLVAKPHPPLEPRLVIFEAFMRDT